jgi:ABC-type multidrug transport system permease subunit
MLGINSPPKLFDGCLKIDCRPFWLAFSSAIVGVTYFSSCFNMSLLMLWSLDVLDFLQVLYNFLSYSMVFFVVLITWSSHCISPIHTWIQIN